MIEIAFCPACNEECFEVEITESGQSFDGERTVHWAQGDGTCTECGYSGFWSDSD